MKGSQGSSNGRQAKYFILYLRKQWLNEPRPSRVIKLQQLFSISARLIILLLMIRFPEEIPRARFLFIAEHSLSQWGKLLDSKVLSHWLIPCSVINRNVSLCILSVYLRLRLSQAKFTLCWVCVCETLFNLVKLIQFSWKCDFCKSLGLHTVWIKFYIDETCIHAPNHHNQQTCATNFQRFDSKTFANLFNQAFWMALISYDVTRFCGRTVSNLSTDLEFWSEFECSWPIVAQRKLFLYSCATYKSFAPFSNVSVYSHAEISRIQYIVGFGQCEMHWQILSLPHSPVLIFQISCSFNSISILLRVWFSRC